jgi:hypothetical protein
MNRGPIFIAGLERSGTSLAYALLASHPNIAMTRRTNLWTYFYNQFGDLSKPQNFEQCLTTMMRYKRLAKLKLDPERLRREFTQGERSYGRLFALLEEHHAERLGKSRWGDKSLNTERYAQPIFLAYPSAKILHMMRDPRDRYSSVVARWGQRRGGVGAGTAMWLDSASWAQRNHEQFPENYMIVRYETLVAQPEATVRQICAFIGEEYQPEMLGMQGAPEFRNDGGNSSYGSRTPGQISTNSIGRYRKVLTPRDIQFIQMRAKQKMPDFGYELDPIQWTSREQLTYALVHLPVSLAQMLAWRLINGVENQRGRALPAYRIIPEASTT